MINPLLPWKSSCFAVRDRQAGCVCTVHVSLTWVRRQQVRTACTSQWYITSALKIQHWLSQICCRIIVSCCAQIRNDFFNFSGEIQDRCTKDISISLCMHDPCLGLSWMSPMHSGLFPLVKVPCKCLLRAPKIFQDSCVQESQQWMTTQRALPAPGRLDGENQHHPWNKHCQHRSFFAAVPAGRNCFLILLSDILICYQGQIVAFAAQRCSWKMRRWPKGKGRECRSDTRILNN